VDPEVVAARLNAIPVAFSHSSHAGLPARMVSAQAGFLHLAKQSTPVELEFELQLEEDSDTDAVADEVGNLIPALDDLERTWGGAGLTPECLSINYRAKYHEPPPGLFDRLAARMRRVQLPAHYVEPIPENWPFPGGALATAITGCMMVGIRLEIHLRGPNGSLPVPIDCSHMVDPGLLRIRNDHSRLAKTVHGPCVSVCTPFALQLGLQVGKVLGQIADVVLQLSDEQVLKVRQMITERTERFAVNRLSRT